MISLEKKKNNFSLKMLVVYFILSLTHSYIYIYIYIIIHRQTVSFYQNSSMWLDTQDAWSRDRNLSNFTLD